MYVRRCALTHTHTHIHTGMWTYRRACMYMYACMCLSICVALHADACLHRGLFYELYMFRSLQANNRIHVSEASTAEHTSASPMR